MIHRRPMLQLPRHVDCHPSKYKLAHSCKEGSSSHSPKNCSQRLCLISTAPSSWCGQSKTIVLLRKTKSRNQRNPVGAVRNAGDRGEVCVLAIIYHEKESLSLSVQLHSPKEITRACFLNNFSHSLV